MRASGRAEDALAQQGKTGAAVHGALEQFEAMHVPFHLAIAPREAHRGQDRVVIAPETGGERPEFISFRIGKPCRERARVLGHIC